MATSNSDDERAKKEQYVRKHNVHHLFELLATKTLQQKPDNIFAFLRDQLTIIEDAEGLNRKKHDPTKPITPCSPNKSIGSHNDNKGNMTQPIAEAGSQNKKTITIGMFGLDNAGKTALLAAMSGAPDPNTKPTIGFTPSQFVLDTAIVNIFDLGGGKGFRAVWPHYFHDCHAFIFVVDGAQDEGTDIDELSSAREEFRQTFTHEYARGKPVLLAVNKKDLTPKYRSPERVCDLLKVEEVLPGAKSESAFKVVATHATMPEPGDPAIDEGVDWIMKATSAQYSRLNDIVNVQTAEVKAAKKRRLEEQRQRIRRQQEEEAAQS